MFADDWFPIQVKQVDKVGRPDIAQFCHVMERETRPRGFFVSFGYSRDDAERAFLVTYVEQGILPKNPFQTIDREGVGRLMQMAINDGRKTRANLEVGICGEHGGDPDSIEWCHLIGNNYVSCSPFRVPIARLAAGHSALKYYVKGAKKPVSSKTAKPVKTKAVKPAKAKVAKKVVKKVAKPAKKKARK